MKEKAVRLIHRLLEDGNSIATIELMTGYTKDYIKQCMEFKPTDVVPITTVTPVDVGTKSTFLTELEGGSTEILRIARSKLYNDISIKELTAIANIFSKIGSINKSANIILNGDVSSPNGSLLAELGI